MVFSLWLCTCWCSTNSILFIVSTDLHLRLVRLIDHGLESTWGRNFVFVCKLLFLGETPCFCVLSLRMELGLLLDTDSGIRRTFALTWNGCISRDFLSSEEIDLEWVVVLVGSKQKTRLVSVYIECSTNDISSPCPSLPLSPFISLETLVCVCEPLRVNVCRSCCTLAKPGHSGVNMHHSVWDFHPRHLGKIHCTALPRHSQLQHVWCIWEMLNLTVAPAPVTFFVQE